MKSGRASFLHQVSKLDAAIPTHYYDYHQYQINSLSTYNQSNHFTRPPSVYSCLFQHHVHCSMGYGRLSQEIRNGKNNSYLPM